jgi:AcrR family transcriptional regulator
VGVKERQERDREAVSRSILDAARDLFVAEGYQNVSIRKIAERIEYSPAAIYGYFGSKDDIFFALAEEGFRLLFSCTAEADGSGAPITAEQTTDPLDSIRRALMTVYAFSKSHPEYFALMFVDRSVPRISKNWERFGFIHEMRARMDALIQSAIDAGPFPAGSRPGALFRILMTGILGASVARLCDRLSPGEDADAIARDILEATLTGPRAGSPVTSQFAGCPVPGNLQ